MEALRLGQVARAIAPGVESGSLIDAEAVMRLGLACCAFLGFLLVLAGGCKRKQAPSKPATPAAGTPVKPASPTRARENGGAALEAPGAPARAGSTAAGVGAACKSPRPFAQGNCARGLFCAPTPGGFCTTFCEAHAGCPGGARCIPSPRGGELCAPPCTGDADCRAAQGYRCDRGRRVCVLPGMASPKLRACAAPARPQWTFGTARQLTSSRGPGRYHFEPVAALLPDGSVTVTYLAGTRTGRPNPLGSVVVAPDGTVGAERTLRFGRENHFDPWVTRTRDGKLFLVWLGFDGGRAPEKRMQVGMSTSRDGVTWSPARAVHDVARDCPKKRRGCLDKPMIVAGPAPGKPGAESLYVFYYSAVTEGLRVRRSTDGGRTFSASVAAGAGAYGDARVDARGVLHVVYVGPRPKARRTHPLGDRANAVWYTRSRDGGRTFLKPIAVSTRTEPIPFFFSNPQVVSDPRRGLLYIVYPSGGPAGTWDLRLAVSANQGRTWRRRRIHDDVACANHMVPVAAFDRRSGALHLAWYENGGGAGRVAYARCDARRCSQPESVSQAPFAAYELVRHSPKWLGEYFALLIDSPRRALHAVWTQTVSEKGRPVARIFHARGKLR